MNEDTLDCITTYSKIRFSPAAPNTSVIKLMDIAHSLSLLCRANGHFEHFFSVAQHCINCAAEARARGYSKKVALACLLHDASEAYISDITRPVKRKLLEYVAIESRLQECIWKAFRISLNQEETKQVYAVDDAMLYAEFDTLMGEKVFPEAPDILSDPDFSEKDFKKVEQEFVMNCMELMG
jgi:hypothetical protein